MNLLMFTKNQHLVEFSQTIKISLIPKKMFRHYYKGLPEYSLILNISFGNFFFNEYSQNVIY